MKKDLFSMFVLSIVLGTIVPAQEAAAQVGISGAVMQAQQYARDLAPDNPDQGPPYPSSVSPAQSDEYKITIKEKAKSIHDTYESVVKNHQEEVASIIEQAKASIKSCEISDKEEREEWINNLVDKTKVELKSKLEKSEEKVSLLKKDAFKEFPPLSDREAHRKYGAHAAYTYKTVLLRLNNLFVQHSVKKPLHKEHQKGMAKLKKAKGQSNGIGLITKISQFLGLENKGQAPRPSHCTQK